MSAEETTANTGSANMVSHSENSTPVLTITTDGQTYLTVCIGGSIGGLCSATIVALLKWLYAKKYLDFLFDCIEKRFKIRMKFVSSFLLNI